MSIVSKLQHILHEEQADEALIDLIPSLAALLPSGVEFEQDTWDLLVWQERKGNMNSFNVFFDKIKNEKLKAVAKIYVLEKRQRLTIKPRSIKSELVPIYILDQALGMRPIQKLTNAIFVEAQDLISSKFIKTSAPRQAGYLQAFGAWLAANLGYRISYKSTLATIYQHGRKATDEERDNKLIDNRMLEDMVAANQREDLIAKDQFYLSAFIVLVVHPANAILAR